MIRSGKSGRTTGSEPAASRTMAGHGEPNRHRDATLRISRRRRRLPVVVAALTGVSVAAGGALAVQRATSETTEPVVVDAEVATFVSAPPTAASVATASASLDPVSRSIDDGVGDSDFAVADVVSATVVADASGFVDTSLVVDEWTDPASDDWRFGNTGPTWTFDVDGDDVADVEVQSRIRDGELRAAVIGARGVVRCLGEPSSNEAASSYSVRFDVGCIGNPKTMRFNAGFEYEDVNFDLIDSDDGPDTGWSSELDNPAFTAPLVTVDPLRLFDSRNGLGRRAAGSTTEVAVAGLGGVPDDARAVVLNLAAVKPASGGYITAYPCGGEQPVTSSLNYLTDTNTSGAVVAKVGDNGAVCLFSFADTELVVDVNGYVPRVSDVGSLPPARVFDSRESVILAADSVTAVEVTDRLGVPADAAGVIITIAVTKTAGRGYITAFPCGSEQPTTAVLTYEASSTASNAAVARVGDGGAVCFYTQREAHLIVDVTGFLPATTKVEPVPPARLLDTRGDDGRREPGTTTELVVTSRGGVPDVASGVVLNVTAVNPSGTGYVTVFPCGDEVPLAANLTYAQSVNSPNAVVAKVADDGTVCFFTSAEIDLVVDVNGYVP